MAKVYLEANDSFELSSNATIFGATGSETVLINGTPDITLDPNVERVELSGDVADYTFEITGTIITVYSGGSAVVTFTSLNQVTDLVFADGAAELSLTGLNTATLGGTAISTTAAAVVPAVIDDTDTSDTADGGTTPVEGQTFTLTNSATPDSIIGTSGNDTINGPSGTVADTDLLIDSSTTDNDTANLVVTAAYIPSNITNIENVNVDWNAYGTATYDFTGVTGANEITLTSSKVGFLGSSSINAGKSNTITAGSGMNGTMTVTASTTDVTVNGGVAKALSVTGTGIANVTAGTSTTSVTTAGYTTATINAGTATAVSVADDAVATNATALTVNANATITNATTGALALTLSDTNNVTMNLIGTSLDVKGDGNVVINSTGLNGETATNSKTSGTLTYVSSATTAHDVDAIAADLFKFTGNVNGAITVANGANVEFSAATTLQDITVVGAGTSDVVNVTFSGTAPTATALTLSGVETLNVTAAATAGTGTDFTVTALDLDTASNKVVLLGSNDVSLGNITGTGTVDASAATGAITLTQIAGATTSALTLTGSATATNSATFTATTVDSTYTGGAGNDTVVFVQTTGNGTAVVGDGTNSVTAAAVTTGTLVVIGGTGNDTVSATALTTGNVSAQLGDGTNSLTVSGTLAGATVVLEGGAGDDTLTIGSAISANDNVTAVLGNGTNTVNIQNTATGANTLNFTGGSGTDTLSVAAGTSLAASTLTLTDFDVIDIAAAGTVTFDSAQLSGKVFNITGNAAATDILAVTVNSAAGDTIDLSGLVMNQTILEAVSKTLITGDAGNDTITGTTVADTINAAAGINTITGGKGADAMTSNGTDTFVIASGDSGKTGNGSDVTANTFDTIVTFGTGVDKLKLGVAGDATASTGNYVEVTAADLGTIADVVTAANNALATLNGTSSATQLYAMLGDTTIANDTVIGGYLAIDNNSDGVTDMLIALTGVNETLFAATDIIA